MKITEDKLRAALHSMHGDVTLSEWDKQRMLRNLQYVGRKPRRRWLRRVASVAVAFALCMTLTVCVLAVPDVSAQLGALSRRTLAYLRPVQKTVTNNDVRMEVIAAMNDGDTAVIYASLQDLSGQNRLDTTTWPADLFVEGLDSTSVDNVYQREDGAVILRITAQCDTGEPLNGKKVTLRMGALLSQCQVQYMQDTGWTVADVQAQNPSPALAGLLNTGSYSLNGGFGGKLYTQLENGQIPALKQLTDYQGLSTPLITVCNAGVVDNDLYILVDRDNEAWYNSVSFALADANGEEYALESAVVPVGEELPTGQKMFPTLSDLQQHVLTLPRDVSPDEVHICTTSDTYGSYIPGEWQVTFTLEQAVMDIVIPCALDMEPWTLQEVTVSAIGVGLSGEGEVLSTSRSADVSLQMADGTISEGYESASMVVITGTDGEDDSITEKRLFAEPIDTSQVVAILVNGETVWQRPAQ